MAERIKGAANVTEEGEEMTREEVVQAALMVERWCKEHKKAAHDCDCPFYIKLGIGFGHCALWQGPPYVGWGLEKFLRTRGLNHDD